MQSKRQSRHSAKTKPAPVPLEDRSDEEMNDNKKNLSQVSLEAVTEKEARQEKKLLQEREVHKKQLAKLLTEQ